MNQTAKAENIKNASSIILDKLTLSNVVDNAAISNQKIKGTDLKEQEQKNSDYD